MIFTPQENVVCHRYVNNVTKFVALLNKGQVVIEVCSAYSINFSLHNNVDDVTYQVRKQRWPFCSFLDGSFEWNFRIEQKEQKKVLEKSDKDNWRNGDTRRE